MYSNYYLPTKQSKQTEIQTNGPSKYIEIGLKGKIEKGPRLKATKNKLNT
jgi:hypothetical protein